MVVDGRLGGKQCPLTIDTGSSISLVRPDLLQDKAEPLQEGWLRTVTGERAPVHGWSNMQLGIGTLELPHKMLVADIKDECILGFDFLKKHGCSVDLKGVLSIHNQQVQLQWPKDTSLSCCRVTLGDNVDLPPMSETVASARILDRPSSGGWDILEPDYCDSSIKPKDGLLVGRTLVNLSAEKVPVHLMNLTTQSKRLQFAALLKACWFKTI